MEQEEIKSILEHYDKLKNLVLSTLSTLREIDSKRYDTGIGIEEIEFEDNQVNIRYDDSIYGCYDSGWIFFPLTFLSMTDKELTEAVEEINEKERLKKQAQIMAQERLDEKNKHERELREYERLKEKFES